MEEEKEEEEEGENRGGGGGGGGRRGEGTSNWVKEACPHVTQLCREASRGLSQHSENRTELRVL